MAHSDKILAVNNLKMYFPVSRGGYGQVVGTVKAVDGVTFSVEKGKTFGLVGESGCGKTTVGKCILRINKPTDGDIVYNGQEISRMTDKAFAPNRRKIQMIFQDPYGSLDPRCSVFQILQETIKAGTVSASPQEIYDKVNELLYTVELDPAMSQRFPHEMSGGQRQRLGIARALACNPDLIVCDEPVSALDVSIQAQIINLFKRIQRDLGLTYVFIAHDLAVVRHISDQVGVMYLGHLVEVTEAADLYAHPYHPYTKALLSAIPITDYYKEKSRPRVALTGEVPSPLNVPKGCPFHPRCKYATEACRSEQPQLKEVEPGHFVACHLLG